MLRIAFLILTLTTVSCGQSQKEEASLTLSASFPVSADPYLFQDNYIPSLAETFSANVLLANFGLTEEQKFERAVEILKLVISTEEFKDRVLNYTYNGTKTFVDNGGYTNAQIYQRIIEAAEVLKPVTNNTLDGEVELYYEASNTVGYTKPTTVRIWMNRKYFSTYTSAGVAHNLMHEWLHKLGFEHAVSYSPSRDSSVPYAIGYIVQEIGNKFL